MGWHAIALWIISCFLLFGQSDQDPAALVQQGRFEQAIPLLEQFLAQSPNDLKARNLLGIGLASLGRLEAANEQFRKAVEIDPRSMPSVKNLALNELALDRRKEARGHFAEVLKVAPKDAAAHTGLAEIEFREGHYTEAVSHFEQGGDVYLRVPVYTVHYALSCVQTKRESAAAEALKRIAPGADAQTHFEAGLLLSRLGQFEAAAGHFQLAESGQPDFYDAGYNLALAYIKAKQPAPAVETCKRLLDRGHQKAELYNLLSQAYELDGKTKEAYDALRTATRIDPKDETNYLDLMALCLDHQNWELSLEIAAIGLKEIPGSYRLHLQRGGVFALKAQYEDAEREFLAATQASPQVTLPYVALALAKMQTNRLGDAVELLRGRRKATPKDYLVNWFLGEALNRSGVTPGTAAEQEAVQALEQSVQSNPTAEPPRVLLGKFLAKRGETARAIAQFERALELDPEDSSATYQLAQAYRKQGDQRAAALFAKVSKEKAEARERINERNLVKIIREGAQ